MTYGGVSLFVVVFAVYPLAISLFREANLPRRLIPGTVALGAFTFTMTAMPGTPQIQNLIPTQYFHTTPTAAPVIGIAASLIMGGGGSLHLCPGGRGSWCPKGNTLRNRTGKRSRNKIANFRIPCCPCRFDHRPAHLESAPPGHHRRPVVGNLAHPDSQFPEGEIVKAINEGAVGSVAAIINTSPAVGFGTVVKAVPGFETLTNLLISMKGNSLDFRSDHRQPGWQGRPDPPPAAWGSPWRPWGRSIMNSPFPPDRLPGFRRLGHPSPPGRR